MINATFKKYKEDYKAITEVLCKKGVTDFDKYFHYNKEYWWQRVRMPCLPPNEHARQVALIHQFAHSNEATHPFYTEDIKK